MTVGLSILIHGDAKKGKTWLCSTAPKPILYLDVEGGSRFVPTERDARHPGMRRTPWIVGQSFPKEDWDAAVVRTRTPADVRAAYQYLRDKPHPFKSVVLDSVSNLQKRVLEEQVGQDRDAEQSDWNKLLRSMEDIVQKLVDLTDHPTRPLDCVAMTTHTWERDGKLRPMVKGQLALTLPGFPDVIGYMYTVTDPNVPGPTGIERRLAIQPILPEWIAGDRTDVLTQRLGASIRRPNLATMWRAINAAPKTDSTEETTEQ